MPAKALSQIPNENLLKSVGERWADRGKITMACRKYHKTTHKQQKKVLRVGVYHIFLLDLLAEIKM